MNKNDIRDKVAMAQKSGFAYLLFFLTILLLFLSRNIDQTVQRNFRSNLTEYHRSGIESSFKRQQTETNQECDVLNNNMSKHHALTKHVIAEVYSGECFVARF